MPQMSPMSWTAIFLILMFLLLSLMNFMPNTKHSQMKPTKINKKMKKILW